MNRNVAASVRQKLLNISVGKGEDFGLILTRYALERLLYRLSQSEHSDQFVLKGAMLFQVWAHAPHRPTRDLDLLGRGDPSPERCQKVFQELCAMPVPDDGLIFRPDSVRAQRIKDEQLYEGVRLKFIALLDHARISIQVDIGFGDSVTPTILEYPSLLSMPAPRIQSYTMESVIAEKSEAIVSLGMLNSRMKDFFDIWFLASTFAFDERALNTALRATFEGRGTPIDPDRLTTLIAELSTESMKQVQWRAFTRKSDLAAPAEFATVIDGIRQFLLPSLVAIAKGVERRTSWPPGGPWLGTALERP